MVQLKNDDAVILTTMESSYTLITAWTWTYYQWDRFLQVACCFRYIFIYIIYTHMAAQRQRDLDVERVRRQRRNYVYVAGRFYAPKSAPAEQQQCQHFSAQAFCYIAARATTADATAAADAAASSQSVCACAQHRPAASQRAYCDRIGISSVSLLSVCILIYIVPKKSTRY